MPNKYGTDDPVYTGKCTFSTYNHTEKIIRFILKFSNGAEQGFDWPISMFKFGPGMDQDAEMRKTSELMRGKMIDVMVKKSQLLQGLKPRSLSKDRPLSEFE